MAYDRLTNDLFKSNNFSRNELDLFGVDLINRLIAKATGIVPKADEDLLGTLHKAFKTSLGKLATEGAVQVGGTLTREDAFDDVIDFVRRQEGLIKSKFNKPSAAYLAFYPNGLTEYNKAKVEGLTDLLVRYVSAANTYKTELGNDFVTEITQLQSNYLNARGSQGTGIANTKSTQSEIRENRKALTKHLTTIVHLVAARTVEEPAEFNSYFNFGLLEVDNDKDGDDNGDTPPEG